MTTNAIEVACPSCGAVNRVPADKIAGGSATKGKCGKCGKPLYAGHPVAVTAATFAKHVRRGGLPVVIDFWAPWCGPCRMMAPVFEQAAAKLEPRVRLIKIDTEAEPMLASRFGIRSIPTIALFKDGEEIARQSGAMPLQSLLGWVESYL